jgi:transcriptional regulator with XRE-family HTH domain
MRPITALGQYLRARRALVRPEDVGLGTFGRRRVPGLRREELATLAGISADYYLRLEQGRDRHPSAPILDALASALRLDADAAAHLHALARPAVPRQHDDARARAPAHIERLIASWPDTPALVHDRHLDVLAANPLASALAPLFVPDVNLVRAVFLDAAVRRSFRDWEAIAHSAVGGLRALAGAEVDDARVADLVAELSEQSELFRRLWGRHDIQATPSRTLRIDHPRVGPLEVHPERLAITSTHGQLLIVFHADPGTPSERALAALARLVAGPPPA